jgi:hypothetical protein
VPRPAKKSRAALVMPAGARARSPRRSGAVLVLLTPEERGRLKEAAQREGLGVGPWLRALGLREAGR